MCVRVCVCVCARVCTHTHHTLSICSFLFIWCVNRRRLSSIVEKGVCSNEEWTELVECVHQVETAGQEVMGVHMREECCAALK